MKKILITTVVLSLAAVPALAAQQDIAQISSVTASREALRTAVNTQLSAVQSNFDEVYAAIDAGPVYVNASAPADTKVVWIDTDQSNAIKVYVGGVWTVVGSGGEGSYTLPTAAADTLGGVKVGARLTITDGVLSADVQTPSGSATYPSAAGVANWGGSAWGTSYTVGTAANNLVQLNSSAQLPAVSGALLTNIPMPAWLPASAPTADNMIIQATGGCSDSQYTDQPTCEANSGTWTPPVGAWTNIIDGLINDAGTGTDDLLSASEIDTRISAAGAFYQVAGEAELRVPATLTLTTDTSITAQQVADNKYVSNYGASGEVDIILPAISYNQTRTILIEAAQVLEISPPSGEVLELSGTDLTADYCVNSGSVVGNKATVTRLRTGASTWKWSIDVVRGTWASCGAASD